MLRFTVHRQRKYKTQTKKETKADEMPEKDAKEIEEGETNYTTEEDTEEGSRQSTVCDQDNDVSLVEEKDEESDKVDEEYWIEKIMSRTEEAE